MNAQATSAKSPEKGIVTTDANGYRRKFGVIMPSTNTVVEYDFPRLMPSGVTCHYGRLLITEPAADTDEKFDRLMTQIREGIPDAIRSVLTAEPDHIVMGMSSETFWGGLEGNQRLEASVRELAGLDITTGAEACQAALRALGVTRVGVVTPYQPIGDKEVQRYFGDIGVDVVAIDGLRCATAVKIAHVTEDELMRSLIKVNRPEVEALIQVGTNLSMVRLADEAERWLKKPVLAINAITVWKALRSNGIDDKIQGAGVLLREF